MAFKAQETNGEVCVEKQKGKYSSWVKHALLKCTSLFLIGTVGGKPLGYFINISLTFHYNPIIPPLFTASSFSMCCCLNFLFGGSWWCVHYSYISFAYWNGCASWASMMINLFASKPAQIIRNACGFISDVIIITSFLCLCLRPPREQKHMGLSQAIKWIWPWASIQNLFDLSWPWALGILRTCFIEEVDS